MVLALTVVLLCGQLGDGDADAGVEHPALAEAREALTSMRNLLRAVEHGLQEANDLGDRAASECVKNGQLAIAHRVESAEQWGAMLPGAVADGDADQVSRLLRHITDTQRDVQRKASDLASCRLKLEPRVPVSNRSWFGCEGTPPDATNPSWRSCENTRSSVVTFGLEGLLVAVPVAGVLAVTQRGAAFESLGGLTLESGAGGLLGGLALFTVSGAVALAVTSNMPEGSARRALPWVGLFTAVGVGAGSITGMLLERPGAGIAAPISAAVGWAVVVGLSALLTAVHEHFGVTATGDDSPFAEKTFVAAPVLMILSALVTMPAAWSLFAKQ